MISLPKSDGYSGRSRCAIVGAGTAGSAECPASRASICRSRRCATPSPMPGFSRRTSTASSAAARTTSYCHHQLVGERLGINVRFSTSLDNGGASQILARGARRHGDQGRARHHGDLRLWPRCLVAHAPLGRGAGQDSRPRPDDQSPQEFAPEYGYFGAVAAHAFGAHAAHASITAPRATSSARSRSPAASTRCAIPTRR